MNKVVESNLPEDNEYKEECIFTSIDIFSGPYNYLNFYFICEILFNDFSFISPYHCYFFLRNQFDNLKDVETNFLKNTNCNTCESDPLNIINEKKAIELFQNENVIYYCENEMTDLKRKEFENIIDIINKLTIPDLIEISVYFNENPNWSKNKLIWMDMIQRDKFRRYEKMRENLKETGKREIIYKVNTEEIERMKNKKMIKDFLFFGVYENKGQNNLGRIYMNIRNDLLKNNEIYTWLLTNCNMQTDENLLADIFIEETYLEKKLIDSSVIYNDKLIEKTKKELSGNINYTSNCYSVEEKTKKYCFEKKEFISFGKNEKNDIICLNPSISRFHCVLYICKDYHVYLIDVGSKSKTKLNDNVCEIHKKYKISNNDMISLGVSKRTYKININIEKVLSYLDKKKSEINKKMKIINEEIENPLKCKNFLKLKVSNIYYKCNENDILDFFKNCGQIKKIQMYNVHSKNYFNNSKKPRFLKEALIEVYDKETSSKIMQNNECFLYGRKIYITYQPIQSNDHDSTFKKNPNYSIEITCKNSKYKGEKIIIPNEKYNHSKNKNEKIYDEKNKDKKINREKSQYKKFRSERYYKNKIKNNKTYKKRSASRKTLNSENESRSESMSKRESESKSENEISEKESEHFINVQKYKKKYMDKKNQNISVNKRKENRYSTSSSLRTFYSESSSSYEKCIKSKKEKQKKGKKYKRNNSESREIKKRKKAEISF
ncbi:conserved Plasmodium protein, unknown function [Plasmodium relictum]|uniref:FHA domain-containing protein n=1 Tax=Plasmodium relictum TaxID=85471 RepID=A0A1J1H9U8_PLARL|nr:conserved Plasmodium protein, unknown function [Plasmodium relictum]CRH00209.1 conserved Plasmodium protein, unknown function [Plasmodium relictum]